MSIILKRLHHLEHRMSKRIILIFVCINTSGCLHGWTQQLPADINYEERHKQTLERRLNNK
jgi:hypothetical protein